MVGLDSDPELSSLLDGDVTGVEFSMDSRFSRSEYFSEPSSFLRLTALAGTESWTISITSVSSSSSGTVKVLIDWFSLGLGILSSTLAVFQSMQDRSTYEESAQ